MYSTNCTPTFTSFASHCLDFLVFFNSVGLRLRYVKSGIGVQKAQTCGQGNTIRHSPSMLRRKHAATPAPGSCFPDFLARITSNIEALRSIVLRLPFPRDQGQQKTNNNSTLTQIMDSRFYLPQADSKKMDGYKNHSIDVCEVCLGNASIHAAG